MNPGAIEPFDRSQCVGKDYHEPYSRGRREEAHYNDEVPAKAFEWYMRAV